MKPTIWTSKEISILKYVITQTHELKKPYPRLVVNSGLSRDFNNGFGNQQ